MGKILTIGYTELKISLPIFIAKEKNLFKKHGLNNVELKPYATAQSLMNDLINHKIEMGGYTALPIAFSAMKKTKLLFIGGIYENNEYPISFLLINKDNKEIKSIQDLKGKTIGILNTDAYEKWIETILKKEGLLDKDLNGEILTNKDRVKIKKLAPELQEDMLKSNEISALFTNDPMASDIIRKGIGVRLSEEALVPKATGIQPFYFGSFNITTDFFDSNKDDVEKVTLALNDAIVMIGKDKYHVDKSLKNYLPKYKDTIEFFEKTNFKTSQKITNNDLEKMKLYYYQQNLFRENIDTKNLQYTHTNSKYKFISFMRNKFLPFLEENWKLFSLIIMLGGWGLSIKQKNDTNYEKAKEYQKGLIESRRSQQAQFRLEYGKVDTYSESIKLINIGRSALKNVKVQMEMYFISDTNKLYSSATLAKVIFENKTLLEEFKKENILDPSQEYTLDDLNSFFDGWFNTKELDPIKSVEGTILDNKLDKNSIDLIFGSSSRINAIKLNKIFKMQIIMRLKIKYNEEISGKLRKTNKFIWFEQDKKNKIKRHDLDDIYGGKRVIKIIEEFERTTQDIIFNQ